MELDMQHDREFYLVKAEECPPFERVLYGETSLTETLDAVVNSLEVPDDATKDLILMIANLSDHPGKEEMVRVRVGEKRHDIKMVKLCCVYSLRGVTLIEAMTAIILLPEVSPAATLYAATVLGMGGTAEARLKDITSKISKAREEILKPLYSTASRLDREIGICFSPEHFRYAQQRFEETYHVLSGDEQETVDAQLHSFLGVGGMPGMDEIQLNDYLNGLLTPEGD